MRSHFPAPSHVSRFLSPLAVGPHYAENSNITHAAKLRGKLMLVVGELDTNVPPESTFRFADALTRAGKDFELVVVPGMGHSDGGPRSFECNSIVT